MLIFIFVSSKETKWCFLICFPCIKKKYTSNILKEISLYHFTSISVSVLHWIFPITYWANGKKGQWNVWNTHRKHTYKGTLFFFTWKTVIELREKTTGTSQSTLSLLYFILFNYQSSFPFIEEREGKVDFRCSNFVCYRHCCKAKSQLPCLFSRGNSWFCNGTWISLANSTLIHHCNCSSSLKSSKKFAIHASIRN